MTTRVGPKGQVVIPKRVRDELGLAPGDEVVVERERSEVRVRRLRRGTRLFGALADSPYDLLADLEAEHQSEVERDERRTERRSIVEARRGARPARTDEGYRRIAHVAQSELPGAGPRAPITGPMVREMHMAIATAGREPAELDAPGYAHGLADASPHPDVRALVKHAVDAGTLRPKTFYGRKAARIIRALVLAERGEVPGVEHP